jgi:RimJ/RimL family protein N-acetyltransferase
MASGFTMPLSDGELVNFRQVGLGDKEIIQNGVLALSAQSRYFRFFTPITQLSAEQLCKFTEIDQHKHVAWIALTHGDPRDSGIGVARFIRIQDKPEIAEFGIVVMDSYQKRGLGTILLALLYLMAKMEGIQILRGFVLPENKVMGGWLHRLGAVGLYENDMIQMDLAVGNNLSSLPTARNFCKCIETIEALQGFQSSLADRNQSGP